MAWEDNLTQALVFGILCPHCAYQHLLGPLGLTLRTEDGEEAEFTPSLGLIRLDEENEVGHIRCLECWKTFAFALQIMVPVVSDQEPEEAPN